MVRILCETMNKVKIVILLLFVLFAACSEDKPLNHGLSFGYYNDWAKVAIGEEREAMIRFGSPDVDCDTPRLAFYLHGPLDTLVLPGFDWRSNRVEPEVVDSLLRLDNLSVEPRVGEVEKKPDEYGYRIHYWWTPTADVVEPDKYYVWLLKADFLEYGTSVAWGVVILVKDVKAEDDER